MFNKNFLSNESRENFLAGLCCCMTGICAIPATLLVMALQLGFAVGSVAFNGFLFLITGHAILRLTDLAIYDAFSLQSSMQVGAAGGAIMFPALAVFQSILESCFGPGEPEEGEDPGLVHSVVHNMLSLGMSTAVGAAAGGVGSKVLLAHGVSVLDPLHAARAGALGGAVLGPGVIVGGLILGLIIRALPCEAGSLNDEGV